MNIRKQVVIAGIAAAPLLFTACCTSAPAPSALTEAEQKNIIIDEPLQGKLTFEFIRTWPSENGLTNVAVRARIQTYCMWDWVFDSYKDLDIAYRFAWFNKDGVEVPEGRKPVWSYVTAGYGEELGFGSIAPSADIKTYKLFIRLAAPEEAAAALKGSGEAKSVTAPAAAPAAAAASPADSTAPAAKADSGESDVKKAPRTASDVKTPPSSVTPIKQEVKPAPAATEEVKPVPAAPAKAVPTTAKEVKTPPSSVTPVKLEVKTVPANEEAEADAASVRQATPNKK